MNILIFSDTNQRETLCINYGR